MPETVNMNDYRDAVVQAKQKRNGERVIENRTYAHAAIVMANLFDAAKESVYLLTSGLNPSVYGEQEVIAAVSRFMERGDTSIDLLVETDPSRDHVFLRALAPFRDRASLIRVPNEVKNRYDFNCCIVDNDCYRFEEDRKKCDALVQFGNAKTAGMALQAFLAIKRMAQELGAHNLVATLL